MKNNEFSITIKSNEDEKLIKNEKRVISLVYINCFSNNKYFVIKEFKILNFNKFITTKRLFLDTEIILYAN